MEYMYFAGIVSAMQAIRKKYLYLESALFIDLCARKELDESVALEMGHSGGIRVTFARSIPSTGGVVKGLSVVYPPDGNGWGQDSDTIEIALVGDVGLVCSDKLGYDDVRRFYSVDQIVEEILRLVAIGNDVGHVQKYASKAEREKARKQRKDANRLLRKAKESQSL